MIDKKKFGFIRFFVEHSLTPMRSPFRGGANFFFGGEGVPQLPFGKLNIPLKPTGNIRSFHPKLRVNGWDGRHQLQLTPVRYWLKSFFSEQLRLFYTFFTNQCWCYSQSKTFQTIFLKKISIWWTILVC